VKTIVQTTILRVQEDSNTFRQAVSFARFGYKSILVEGQPSNLNRAELPFKLISIGQRKEGDGKTSKSHCAEVTRQRRGIYRSILAVPYRIVRAIATLLLQLITVCDDASKPAYAVQVERRLNMFGRLGNILIFKLVKPIYDLLPKPLKYLYESLVGWACFLIYLINFLRTYFLTPLRYLPKASLYYLNAPLYFPAIYLMSKVYRAPFIYQAHDFYTGIEKKENLTLLERRWFNPFLFKLERCCINRAAAVVIVSDGGARLLEKAFGCHSVVARSCHDQRLDKTPRVHLRQLLGLSADDFLMVTTGTAKRGQALEESLDAMLKLPDNVHLAFLGKNTAQHIPLIRERGLEKRVHTVPAVMPFEVVPFIQSADASLTIYYARSPNYENCLPNSLFQSIAAELPLLYPELPEISKIAKYYDLGIPINPLDPESIRSGVIQLMSDRELDSKFRKNLRIAKEELSWEREEVVLRDLLSEVLNRCK